MLSQKLQTQASLVAYATVSNMFAMFHNPKVRGANFTWEKFPEMMRSSCRTQAKMSIVAKTKALQDEVDNQTAQNGFDIATQMVKVMTED